MHVSVIRQTSASMLLFIGVALMMVIGKVYPESAIDYWPWPPASIFVGIGGILEQPMLTFFGALFIVVGVFTLAF